MNHTSISQTSSYGLAGIELHRASERRAAEQQRDHIAAALNSPGRVILLRQRLGEALIRAGVSIASNAENAPSIRPGGHPQVDTP